VTVVTTRDEMQRPVGFTANSFSSVSLDPPMLLVCLANGMGSFNVFASARFFAVNILAEDQQELSRKFASRGIDRFAGVPWDQHVTGSPLLKEVVAWFDCQVHDLVKAGDHAILIGRIIDYAYNDRAPLGFCGGAYLRFGLLQRALEMVHGDGQLRVGAVLECDGSLLLEEDPRSQALSVPCATRLGSATERSGLFKKLAELGYEITLPFLFAVYEDGDVQFVIHRGHAVPTGEIARDAALRRVPIDCVPWERVTRPAERMMLERYLRERATNVTGIYVGNAESGELHTVSGTRPL
jgi:flavin reductase (DIM6/NTAB) family NADH-FMN oxidoreductase RutF